MDLGDDATGYSECGEGSGTTCPQSGRAALDGGSEDSCLPEGNQGGDLEVPLFDTLYADRCNERWSVSGVAVMLGNTAVGASSTTQHCVKLSTSEAEYVAMAHEAKIALAIKAVLDFVQPHLSGRAIDMYEDNEGAKALAENPQGSHRNKHIHVRFHFLRGLVRLEQVIIHGLASVEQHADILTKPLGREAFRRHRDFLMNLLKRCLSVEYV